MSVTFKVTVTKDNTSAWAKQAQRQLKALPKEAYNYFVGVTPIDTGNARRNTKLVGNTIEANYAYAKRLDEGWSKQYGGKGMSEPTAKFIEKRLKKIMGRSNG